MVVSTKDFEPPKAVGNLLMYLEACLSNIIAVLFNLMPVYKVIFKEIAKRLGKCGIVQSYR